MALILGVNRGRYSEIWRLRYSISNSYLLLNNIVSTILSVSWLDDVKDGSIRPKNGLNKMFTFY
jgi:hypothetical protein